jgi:hypothetical protein
MTTRIRRVLGLWYCAGASRIGMGYTPAAAYAERREKGVA